MAVQRLRHHIKALAVVLLLGALLGCSSDDEASPSNTQKIGSRSADVPRRSAELLVDAKEALKKGRFRRALALADSSERLAPDHADVSPLYFFRGRVFTQLRQYDYARKSYLKAVELRPAYRGGWYQLGNLAFKRGKYQDALQYYRKEQQYQGRHARISYQIGRSLSHAGRRDSARRAFEETVAIDGSFAPAYMELSALDEEQGQYERALKHARRAVDLHPRNTDYQYQVGALLFQMGRRDEAVERLRQVVRNDPSNHGAHYYLGQALARKGQTEEAQRLLAEADELRKLTERIEKLEREAEVYAQQPKRWIELGSALRNAGRIREAVQAYTIARTLAPRNRAVRDSLAQAKANL